MTIADIRARLRGLIRDRVRADAGTLIVGVRGKVLAFTCALVVLFVASSLAVDATVETTRTRRAAAETLTGLAEGLAATVAGQMDADNAVDLVAIARAVALSAEVDDVYVFDRDGKVLAEDVTGAHRVPSMSEAALMRAMVERKGVALVDGGVVTAAAPIATDEHGLAGYVLVRGPCRNQAVVGFPMLLAVGAVLLLLGGLAATAFSAWLVRPLKALTDAAARIASGDFAKPAVVDRRDEFGSLADALNRVMARTATAVAAYERLQQELMARRERAETANRAKSDFLARVGLELRTSLNAIVGFSDLLSGPRSRAMADTTFTTYARNINRSGRHLLTLVTGILDYVQIDTGTIVLREEPCNLAELVRSVAAPLDDLAEDGGIALTVDTPDALPTVRCDPERLGKALASVLTISIRATRSGGTVAVTVSEDADGSVVVRIADSGIGDSEPAGDDTPSGRSRGVGAGLGLALARKVIELHLGGLRVESYPGAGTIVTVRLPAVVDQGGAAPELVGAS
ncbi:MAG: ATP-binding protein [Gemmatimonas sp.]